MGKMSKEEMKALTDRKTKANLRKRHDRSVQSQKEQRQRQMERQRVRREEDLKRNAVGRLMLAWGKMNHQRREEAVAHTKKYMTEDEKSDFEKMLEKSAARKKFKTSAD